MKKILFITAFYKPYIFGGAEISNELLIDGIKKNNDIKICTLGEKNEQIGVVKQIYINKIIQKYLNCKIQNKKQSIKNKVLLYLYKLTTYILHTKSRKIVSNEIQKKIEILHTSGINYFFPHVWWKIGKNRNCKIIHTLRDPILIYSKLSVSKNIYIKFFDYFHKFFYIHKIYKYVDYIHSPTQYMIDLHIKNGFKFKNTKVIPNTVDIQFELSNYKEKIYDILYVGTLSEAKGIKTLIKLKEVNPSLNIIFVGSGELQNEAIKVGIECTGWLKQNEVFDYMKKSKIVILPSEWEEAFGRVLIEGVASGTISIGSNMGGIPEVLFNDSRYIFEAKNVLDLKNKIERVLNLDEDSYMSEVLDLQKRMEIYKYENHIKQFEEFYDEVLKNRG